MNLIVTNLPFVPDIGGINSMTLHCLYNIHLNLLLVNFILIFYILLPLYLSKKIILLSYYVSLLFLIPNRWPVSSSLLSGNFRFRRVERFSSLEHVQPHGIRQCSSNVCLCYPSQVIIRIHLYRPQFLRYFRTNVNHRLVARYPQASL